MPPSTPLTERPGPGRVAFATALEGFGDATAFVLEDGGRVSYRELAQRADDFAGRLESARVLVQIEAFNALEPLIAYLGCLRADHPVLLSSEGPLNTKLTEVFQPEYTYALVEGAWTLTRRTSPRGELHPDLTLLLSTSGTTGATKLVRLSATAVDANAASIGEYLGLTADERAITSLPFHYSFGLSVVNSHLRVGATLLLTDRSVVDDRFWRLMVDQRATSLAGVPYTYELLRRVGLETRAPDSLRTLTQAGGRLHPDEVSSLVEWSARRGVKFYVMYGQTEATARMAYLPPYLAAENPDSIGVAIPGGAFSLKDEGGQIIDGHDAAGELYYAGPNVMMGYGYSREDLARGAEIDLLATGDLAMRDLHGLYRIVGRKSRFAKLFGLRIGLDEVEAEVRACGGRGVAVSDDERIYIAAQSGDPSVIRHHLSEKYALPIDSFRVVEMEVLPTLASGKLDYRSISDELIRSSAVDSQKNPRTILDCFVYEFPNKQVSSDSTFVNLGGDSLNYVNISISIENMLGELPEDWENTSVSDLEAMNPVSQSGFFFGIKSLESEVFIRMAAIIAVVVNHASDLLVSGGAEVLLILSGYNLNRYQKNSLSTRFSWNIMTSFLRRIIFPYYVLMCAFFAFNRDFDLPSLLLVSNYLGRFGTIMEPFWFLEALAQAFAVVSLLSLAPAVRKAIARDSWAFGLTCVGGTIALKCGAFAVFQHAELENRTVDSILPLLAIGWCLREANTNARRVLMTGVMVALAAISILGLPGVWPELPGLSGYSHAVWLGVSAIGLLWVRRIRLPSWLHMAVGAVAASSFYIYVTHVIPLWIIYWQLEIRTLAVNLTACIVVGLAAAPLFRWWERLRWPPWRAIWPQR